jgi:hypothetical protein
VMVCLASTWVPACAGMTLFQAGAETNVSI